MVFTLVFLAATLSLSVAAKEVTTSDGTVSFSDSLGNISISGTTVKLTAEGGRLGGTKTNTVTMTNVSGKAGKITFSWSASSSGTHTATIDGTVSDSGNFSKNMNAGETITITLYAKGGTLSKNKATLSLTNVTFQEVASTYSVSFAKHGEGTVTINGTAVDYTSSYDLSPTTGAAIVAKASSGYSFVGWAIDDDLLSANSSYTLTPSSSSTVTAVFAKNDSEVWFHVDGKYLIQGLTEACAKGTKIVPAHNGTLVAGNYTIPSGDTLLIPYDAAYTLCTTEPTISTASYKNPTAYRTLTIADGAHITVNGALSVSAMQSPVQGTNGSPTSAMGVIVMQGSSSITVGNGNGTNGSLYVWGYISGSGSVLVKSGSQVYECFQLTDWRGGNATYGMNKNEQEVFPFSQYYVQNIEVPMTVESGATESCYMSVSYTGLTGGTEYKGSAVPFISASSGMFRLSNGSLTKWYDGTTDRLCVEMNCDFQMANISLTVPAFLGISITVDSNAYVLPLNGNLSVTIKEGKTMTLAQDVACLPGFELTIEKKAEIKFNTGKRMYIYDADQWTYQTTDADGNPITAGYVGVSNNIIMPLKNVYGRASGVDRSKQEVTDTVIRVNGTLDATNGYLYTTNGGASICSDENGVVILKKGTDTKTYQVIQSGNEVGSWPEIPITTANLQHGDGTYLSTDGITETTTYRYHETHQRWVAGEHTNTATEITQQATCVLPELSKFTCTCTYVQKDVQTGDPLGHSYNEGETTKAPTCTELGVKTYTCGTCGSDYTESVAMLEHIYDYHTRIVLDDSLDVQFAFSECWFHGDEKHDLSGCYVSLVKTFADNRGDYKPESNDYLGFKVLPDKWASESIGGWNYYYVTFSDVAGKEMCDTITLSLCDNNLQGNDKVFSTYSDSIRDYAMRLLNAGTYTAEVNTMLVDLLHYGAAAQTYYGYDTGDLATSGLSADQKALASAFAPAEGDATVEAWGEVLADEVGLGSIAIEDAYANTVTASTSATRLELTNGFYLHATFNGLRHKNEDGTVNKMTAKAFLGNDKYDLQLASDGLTLYFTTEEIVPLSMAGARTTVVIQVYDGETLVCTVTDSVASYVARVINGTQKETGLVAAEDFANLKALLQRIVMFSDSVKQYVEPRYGNKEG